MGTLAMICQSLSHADSERAFVVLRDVIVHTLVAVCCAVQRRICYNLSQLKLGFSRTAQFIWPSIRRPLSEDQ